MATIQFSSQNKNKFYPTVIDISVDDLRAHMGEVHIVDVRRPDEWASELSHLDVAILLTLDTLPDKISTIPKDKPVVFVCRSGQRSANAAAFALENGFKEVYNMAGGMLAWHAALNKQANT